jgi:L-alanine-DL-glutamate epimerase-like enolase superfamily enzyme
MKPFLKQIVEKERQREKTEAEAIQAEIANPATPNDRRNFLKKAAFGGIALGGLMNMSIEDTIAMTTQKVQRSSNPSDLKITDLRTATTTVLGRTSIIRIDTNQGIYGLGEVRDGADKRYALMLKSRILGENPCNVEKIFKIIKQFGHHARQGGGVCGVEMALWDLCGKAYNVPAWQLLGGRYRDRVRLYADTPGGKTPEEQRKNLDDRVVTKGYTWLKMDLGIRSIMNIPGTLVNQAFWTEKDKANRGVNNYMTSGQTRHPFTQIQITDKGLEEMAKIAASMRDLVGWEIPVFADHFGHFDYNNGIRLGRALEKYRLACMEDVIPWFYTEDWKKLSDALETPMMTGEDIYLLQGFKPLIDARAVDIVHPDLATSGGLLETKRLGDYAEEHGIAMAMHQAGTPVSFMANVHCAAATQNFLALEHHSVDLAWWESLVRMTGKRPIIEKGYAPVPLDSPGLGIELNEAVVKQHLREDDPGYFLPTPEWDGPRVNDRLWS